MNIEKEHIVLYLNIPRIQASVLISQILMFWLLTNLRLQVKETLLIKQYAAHKSLNYN